VLGAVELVVAGAAVAAPSRVGAAAPAVLFAAFAAHHLLAGAGGGEPCECLGRHGGARSPRRAAC
jgi:hypothetical protein